MSGSRSTTRQRLLLLAAAVLFSTGGAAIKATALSSWQVAGFRSIVAGLALLLLVPDSRHRWSARILPPAVAYAATLVLFVAATKLTTAANAIFLESTAPVYLLLIGPVLLHEKARRSDLVFMVAVAGGMALFFLGREHPAATAPDPVRGNILGALAGLAWAFTLAGLRSLGRGSKQGAPMSTVVAGNAIAFLACLPKLFPLGGARLGDLAAIFYLGVFQVGVAYVCLTRALRDVPAFEASAILLAEPALNPVWAWLVHGERPSTLAIAGGALILSATLAQTWRQSRPRA